MRGAPRAVNQAHRWIGVGINRRMRVIEGDDYNRRARIFLGLEQKIATNTNQAGKGDN